MTENEISLHVNYRGTRSLPFRPRSVAVLTLFNIKSARASDHPEFEPLS